MVTTIVIIQLLIILALIFIGARVGGIGLGIYGMIGVFILVYGFGLAPGNAPIDVMMIIVSVITAAAALQASGGLEYLVGVAAKFLHKHPTHITYFGPITCWLFCVVANKIRPERPMSLSVIAASLGITCSPVSAATAALISQDLLGAKGIELGTVLMICIPTALISIIVAAFVQNHVGKELVDDPEYKRRIAKGLINPEEDAKNVQESTLECGSEAKRSVFAFLFGVALVVVFGFVPSLRPEGVSMSQTIEMIMMSDAALILFVGKAKVANAVNGNIFKAGMNAVVAIFGIAWMGNTFYMGNEKVLNAALSSMITSAPILFAVALFVLSIMLFSQAATVTTLYPVGIVLGVNPLLLIAMFPACNGYFFLPNYPTEVAAIDFDRTGTTHIGKYVINHSFQLPGFITTIVSILLGVLVIQFL